MVRTYRKNLMRMFKSNVLRLVALSLIIAIGIAVVTGIGGVATQIQEALKNANGLTHIQIILINEIADKIEIISNVLPPFFIAVSALTALTTIMRLIDEERSIFACYKSLGYSDFLIVFRYLFFAFVCAFLGSLIGLIFGSLVLRPVIFNIVQTRFLVPDKSGLFLSQGMIWSATMISVLILTAFFVSASKSLERPANLLRPKSPKAGRKILLERIPFFWKRLKFKFKSATRNIFRFKFKLAMTVFSVAGSTVMLFVGLGLLSCVHGDNDKIQLTPDFVDSMNVIAVIVTLCGIALSVLVLFNLTNINIEERKREIATLKVLGYNPIEVAGFIYRELLILSVLGIIIGLPSGYYLNGFLFDYLDFGSLELIKWYIWLFVALIAFFSVILADALLYRKLNKIEMVASLKAVE